MLGCCGRWRVDINDLVEYFGILITSVLIAVGSNAYLGTAYFVWEMTRKR
jgi:hypothetical protein